LAAACVALALTAGSWWPVLTAGSLPFPDAPAGGQREAAAREATVGAAAHRAEGRSAPLDLNAADAAALERLPGVGPVLARRIVAHRDVRGPFRSPEDLRQVPGLGESRLARLRPLVRAGEGS
jgi:competence protein ComEA